MTERQKRFVDNYIDSGNGAEAARNAGYAEGNARQQANENITKPDIKAAIADRMDSAGITEAKLLKVLEEGLAATRTHLDKDGGIEETDDFLTRHKYLETGLKLRDAFPAEKKKLEHDFITPEAEKAATERVNKLFVKKQTEANTKG